jgi:threo-3-hydroxy-L-aspartate ammonia-lyase
MSSVTFADVISAAQQLKGYAHRTPVVTSRVLNEQVGAEVFLKCENLQRMGAFKFRGAFNSLSRLTPEERERGVIAFSSGNHAQAVALSGTLLGIRTTIVMPNNAPALKVTATREYGANVIIYDVETQDREQVAKELQAEYGYTLIPPYDYPHVIAGQGTSALELLEDVPDLDALLVCTGGGGLLSGCAIAAKGKSDKVKVYGVEPEVANDAYLSFKTKQLHTIKNPPTIADGTRTPSLGKITFPLVLEYVDDMVTVSEQDLKDAMKFAFYRLKLVIEPSGALSLAAVLSGKFKLNGGLIGAIVSGGNVDADTFAQIITE